MITIGKITNRINFSDKYSTYIGGFTGTGKTEFDESLNGNTYFFDTNNKCKEAQASQERDLNNLETIASFIDENTKFWTCKSNNDLDYICFNCVQECQKCQECQNCNARCHSCNGCDGCNGCNSCNSGCQGCTNCNSCNTCDNKQ